MNFRNIVAAVALLAFPIAYGPAFAQITISPASPKALETVRIHIEGNVLGEWAGQTSPEMSGNKITLGIVYSGVSFGEYPITPFESSLGQLPAGTYEVEVVKRASDIYGNPAGVIGIVGSTTFTVESKSGIDAPRENYTDLWWNAAQSGWGLSIHQHGSDNIFAVWFVYGQDGKAGWYAMPTGQWLRARHYTGAVYRTNGPQASSNTRSTE